MVEANIAPIVHQIIRQTMDVEHHEEAVNGLGDGIAGNSSQHGQVAERGG
jgi:hypothetical protein